MNIPGDATDLLARLIRFDTTNPPGNERPCVQFLADLLDRAGLSTQLLAQDESRPNLIARLPGRGEAPPLLLYGHVDVVTADRQRWTHPPFSGHIADGWLWGRGALDMKSGITMMTSALLRAKANGIQPAGDVLLAILVDEEGGGRQGARFLVESHPETFAGVRYAIGEFGGVPLHLFGRTFYAIQIAEKQPCWLETTVSGDAGHGARPMRGGAMAKLGQILAALDRARTPIHVTPVARRMIETIGSHASGPRRWILRGLLRPRLTDHILGLLGSAARNLEPLFRNTVNATIVRGGEKPNVIPSEIVLGLDARILPGFGVDDLLAELRSIIGADTELRVLLHDPAPPDPDYGLFDALGGILKGIDPQGIPIPLLLPGSTDARFFSRLGIQTYGFTPMKLPPDFDFFSTIHGADERIPIEAVGFGTEAIYRVITQYACAGA